MPAVRMAPIVDQIRRAKRWVDEHIESHGGDPGKLTVSGHSAGAHFATMLFDDDSRPSGIKGALLLGGIYDLRPLQESFLAPEIAITVPAAFLVERLVEEAELGWLMGRSNVSSKPIPVSHPSEGG
ncbi:carboxylesterase family protein [Mesorhizobium sp.]|uniref:alpha/beta hydrolase n=1 Tax=Mesorhizobium sp. TaxID=1871066 RepID=UPI003438991E